MPDILSCSRNRTVFTSTPRMESPLTALLYLAARAPHKRSLRYFMRELEQPLLVFILPLIDVCLTRLISRYHH